MKFTLVSILLFSFFSLSAEDKMKISVNTGDFERTDCVVSVDLSDLDLDEDTDVTLKETTKGSPSRDIDCQIIRTKGKTPVLYWILDGTTPAGTDRDFVIRKNTSSSCKGTMQVENTQRALVLKKDNKEILQYNYAVTLPKPGRQMAFRRSGYIHPAYSPAGNVLSNIQPNDHPHHFGIWNPWTKLMYDGELYDLWNLKDLKGTVRANSVEAVYEGSICAGYRASLDHIIFTPEEDKKIMDETWDIKAWNIPGGYLWDFESGLTPCTSLPVILKAYRYAGFTLRATPEWNRENCEMLTSEGKTRNEIDGTTGRWIFVTGNCGNKGKSGIMFMSHPGNYNHPEPLRVWNSRMHGKGEAFVNFVPTKGKDWTLEAGKNYRLQYRVFTFDGDMTAEKANRLWNDFAFPPKVTVIK